MSDSDDEEGVSSRHTFSFDFMKEKAGKFCIKLSRPRDLRIPSEFPLLSGRLNFTCFILSFSFRSTRDLEGIQPRSSGAFIRLKVHSFNNQLVNYYDILMWALWDINTALWDINTAWSSHYGAYGLMIVYQAYLLSVWILSTTYDSQLMSYMNQVSEVYVI